MTIRITEQGSGGSQTPWLSDIDGGGFKLTNVSIPDYLKLDQTSPQTVTDSPYFSNLAPDGYGLVYVRNYNGQLGATFDPQVKTLQIYNIDSSGYLETITSNVNNPTASFVYGGFNSTVQTADIKNNNQFLGFTQSLDLYLIDALSNITGVKGFGGFVEPIVANFDGSHTLTLSELAGYKAQFGISGPNVTIENLYGFEIGTRSFTGTPVITNYYGFYDSAPYDAYTINSWGIYTLAKKNYVRNLEIDQISYFYGNNGLKWESSATDFWNMLIGGDGNFYFGYSSNNSTWYDKFFFGKNGTLGIGTTSPIAALHLETVISGYPTNNGNARFLQGVDSNYNPFQEFHTGASGFNQGSAAYIDFATSDGADYDTRIIKYKDGEFDFYDNYGLTFNAQNFVKFYSGPYSENYMSLLPGISAPGGLTGYANYFIGNYIDSGGTSYEFFVYAVDASGNYSSNYLDVCFGDNGYGDYSTYGLDFSWSAVSGADHYRVIVYADPQFNYGIGAFGDYYFDTYSTSASIINSVNGYDNISGSQYISGNTVTPTNKDTIAFYKTLVSTVPAYFNSKIIVSGGTYVGAFGTETSYDVPEDGVFIQAGNREVDYFQGGSRKMLFGYDVTPHRGIFYSDGLGGGMFFYDASGIGIGAFGSDTFADKLLQISKTWGTVYVKGTFKADTYQSSDGSAGLTTTQTFKDGSGATKTMTIKNGLITAIA